MEAAIVTIKAGADQVQFTPRTIPAQYHMFLPASSGDVNVELQTNTFKSPIATDQRQLGSALDRMSVAPLSGWLAFSTLGWLILLLMLVWMYAWRIGISANHASFATGIILLAWLVGWLNARIFALDALKPLIIAAILAHLLLIPLRWLLNRTIKRHNLPYSATTAQWVWAVFGLAMLWKLGGMIYPHIRVFDEAAHTLRVQWLLQGRFAELYFPNYTSFMGATVGIEGGYLPYSPLWYIVTAPFRLLGLPIGDTMNGLSAILDVSKGIMIFVIGLATMRRERSALMAMGLYHLFPMPYYLLSWGNYPTQFGLWAALLATTYLILNYDHLMQKRTFMWWIALVALCMATYTVIGIFAWTMLIFVALFELVRRSKRVRGVAKAIILGIIAAEVLMLAIYHIHFVPVVVNNTLPALFNSAQDKVVPLPDQPDDPRESPLLNFQANTIFLRNHTTDIMLIAMFAGIATLFIERTTRRWWTIWAAWLGIFIFYGIVSAFVADMVLKHIFFIMPLMCLGLAWLVELTMERFWASRWIVVASTIALILLTLDRWHFYLLIKRH